MVGTPPPAGEPAINIIHAIGIILLVRYGLFGVLDRIADKSPENIELRLAGIEEKISDLHVLAYGEMEDDEDDKPAKTSPAKKKNVKSS